MKRILSVLAVLAAAAGPVRAEPIVQVLISPSSVTVNGGIAAFDILASLPSEGVIAWDLDLTFGDPSLAALVSVDVGPAWSPASVDGDGLGGLYFPALGEPDALTGDVLLATIRLQGLSFGTTTIGVAAPHDAEGFALSGAGEFASFDVIGSTLTVVPEPATALLVAAGLAPFAGRIRRR